MKMAMASCVALGMVLAGSSPALASYVALVPDTLNVTPGSTVNVAVVMNITSPITMTAISTNILYDKAVFSFDDALDVVKGDLLAHNWSLYGGETAHLRVGGIDLNGDPWYESLAVGSGTLFTFTLRVKADAPAGLSPLTWGVYDGFDNATAGFDYGDMNFVDVMLLNSEVSGASINVVPEPASLALMALGGVALIRRRRRA